MKRLSQCQIRLGQIPPYRFAPTGQPGDWMNGVRVDFATPFATLGEVNPPIRVMVTPFSRIGNYIRTFPVVFVEPWTIDATGFVLSARNAGPDLGSATERVHFSYVAIYEAAPPPVPNPEFPIGVRFGIAQPWHYRGTGSGYLNDRPAESARIHYGPEFNTSPVALMMTGTNLHSDHSAAVTAVPGPLNSNASFQFDSYSSDLSPGNCGFHWAAFAQNPNEPASDSGGLLIDSGHSNEAPNIAYPNDGRISPSGTRVDWSPASDWSYRHIYFAEPFESPPVVLMTARNGPDVCMAFDVTRWGFTGAVRNSDIAPKVRQAHFDWLAIGCGAGCLSSL